MMRVLGVVLIVLIIGRIVSGIKEEEGWKTITFWGIIIDIAIMCIISRVIWIIVLGVIAAIILAMVGLFLF